MSKFVEHKDGTTILKGEAATRVRAILEALQPLRDELKRKAMIYQCEEKEYAAKRQGFPLDKYYRWSYVRWAKVRAKWGFNGK